MARRNKKGPGRWIATAIGGAALALIGISVARATKKKKKPEAPIDCGPGGAYDTGIGGCVPLPDPGG